MAWAIYITWICNNPLRSAVFVLIKAKKLFVSQVLIMLFQTVELHVRVVRFVHTQQILGRSVLLISQIVSFKCNLLLQLWNLLNHNCLSSCPIARLHVWSPLVGFLPVPISSQHSPVLPCRARVQFPTACAEPVAAQTFLLSYPTLFLQLKCSLVVQ